MGCTKQIQGQPENSQRRDRDLSLLGLREGLGQTLLSI